MDSQVLCRDNHGFMFPRNNKSNKAVQNSKKNSNNKPTGSFPKGNNVKNYQQPLPQTSYNQYPGHYPSWNVFDGSRPSAKSNFNQGLAKPQNQSNYAKNFQLNYMKDSFSDKASRSTGTSDNDNGAPGVFSELSGFKIVRNGRTIYAEADADEDFDLFSNADSESEDTQKPKFASSVFTIGPNSKTISVPMFANVDE